MAEHAVPPAHAVGVSWRAELASGLFAEPTLVDTIEVLAERTFLHRAAAREARALAERWPVVPHGVALSLGSADGIDAAHLKRLAALARDVRAPFVSEHIAFVHAGGVDIGHLTQLPRTREALAVLAANVAHAQARLPCPLLLENVAWSIRSRDDEMDEATFMHEVVERTGCGLLLDVSNLRANARNEGRDPRDVLARYPLHAVRTIHVAGARTAADGFVFDTHADPVDDEVLQLLAATLAHTGPVSVVLERDRAFPPFHETRAELVALRDVGVHAALARLMPHAAQQRTPAVPLAQWQHDAARALTSGVDEHALLDARELARARGILARKKREQECPRPEASAAPSPVSRWFASLAGAFR